MALRNLIVQALSNYASRLSVLRASLFFVWISLVFHKTQRCGNVRWTQSRGGLVLLCRYAEIVGGARHRRVPHYAVCGEVGTQYRAAQDNGPVYKDFNLSGENLVKRLRTFSEHGVHVLGSFIFGLPTDREDTFAATHDLAQKAGITFAQFVMLTPFPGTVDFNRWEKRPDAQTMIDGIPLSRYWLIPPHKRPKMFMPHRTMSSAQMRDRTQKVWDNFYSFKSVWRRSHCTPNLRARLAFVFISKLYRSMYAKTGIATDSARQQRAGRWARWLAIPCRKLFKASPMPDLQIPHEKAVPDLLRIIR